ncbi:hypothetical protein BDV96DRAFT_602560 [Lophiotrema nucula]|uniref:Uncharacterized protein n=1 Tax=Lophiotrema nucula TaxID=690887 RepID=A0A6A5Z132_9PLEO|nr:hypothetical protein BDV96DRAFT_602560 [Lophiotrema nucula]
MKPFSSGKPPPLTSLGEPANASRDHKSKNVEEMVAQEQVKLGELEEEKRRRIEKIMRLEVEKTKADDSLVILTAALSKRESMALSEQVLARLPPELRTSIYTYLWDWIARRKAEQTLVRCWGWCGSSAGRCNCQQWRILPHFVLPGFVVEQFAQEAAATFYQSVGKHTIENIYGAAEPDCFTHDLFRRVLVPTDHLRQLQFILTTSPGYISETSREESMSTVIQSILRSV